MQILNLKILRRLKLARRLSEKTLLGKLLKTKLSKAFLRKSVKQQSSVF